MPHCDLPVTQGISALTTKEVALLKLAARTIPSNAGHAILFKKYADELEIPTNLQVYTDICDLVDIENDMYKED